MSGFFTNGKFDGQRSQIARHFDKVILVRLVLGFACLQLALVWILVSLDAEIGRVTSLLTRISDTFNYAITTIIGFLGGIITGKAMGDMGRASDTAPSTPPSPTAAPTDPAGDKKE